MNEPYELTGQDPSNPHTHNLIVVRGKTYSVFIGEEQSTANDIAANLDAS
jgi:hypothetical protein